MAAADVEVRRSIASNAPSMVCLDPLRIRQVIANGVTNALKNTVSGSVTLRVRISEPSPFVSARTRFISPLCCYCGQTEAVDIPNGGPGLLFQVLDTGPGLKGRDYRTLFDPTLEHGNTAEPCSCSLLLHIFQCSLACAFLVRLQTGRRC